MSTPSGGANERHVRNFRGDFPRAARTQAACRRLASALEATPYDEAKVRAVVTRITRPVPA